MSTYTECCDAARTLLKDPGLRIATDGPAEVFTDIDVILLAAREASLRNAPYNDDVMKIAQREASQALGYLFRGEQAVRYGPVIIPGSDEPDYLRTQTRIVYAAPDGPAEIVTPNGTFPRMFIGDDLNPRSGRRLGAARDDLVPWAEQNILDGGPSAPNTIHEREVLRLRAEVAGLEIRLAETQAENRILREQLDTAISRWPEVRDLVGR